MPHFLVQIVKRNCSWSVVPRIHGFVHLLAREQLGTGTFSLMPRFILSKFTSCPAMPDVKDAAQYVGVAQGIQGAFALSTIPGRSPGRWTASTVLLIQLVFA